MFIQDQIECPLHNQGNPCHIHEKSRLVSSSPLNVFPQHVHKFDPPYKLIFMHLSNTYTQRS